MNDCIDIESPDVAAQPPVTAWEQQPGETDCWRILPNATSYGSVSQYGPESLSCAGQYHWLARRGHVENMHSGILPTREDAMAAVEAALAMPLDQFTAVCVERVLVDLHRLEEKLSAIAPNFPFIPGYHAGFEAGMAAMKAKIEAVLS